MKDYIELHLIAGGDILYWVENEGWKEEAQQDVETLVTHGYISTEQLIKGIEGKKWLDMGVKDKKKQLKWMEAVKKEKLDGLRTFLIDLDLEKHLKGFINAGFDTLRKVKKISNVKHLVEAGVKNVVEQKKIFSKIDKMGPKTHLITHIPNEEQPNEIQQQKEQNKKQQTYFVSYYEDKDLTLLVIEMAILICMFCWVVFAITGLVCGYSASNVEKLPCKKYDI